MVTTPSKTPTAHSATPHRANDDKSHAGTRQEGQDAHPAAGTGKGKGDAGTALAAFDEALAEGMGLKGQPAGSAIYSLLSQLAAQLVGVQVRPQGAKGPQPSPGGQGSASGKADDDEAA